MAEVPPAVAEVWRKAHEALQVQLELYLARGCSGTLYGELHIGEAGVPRQWEFTPQMREQVGSREATLQARRRR